MGSLLPQPASHSPDLSSTFQPVFPNYKLEIQDGQQVGVEVIKPESLGFSPY